ncbi:MAG: class II aldolase [Ruminococcaceae bacterium]|nr:class II aldolase [Oscillospiraceae bacterium]
MSLDALVTISNQYGRDERYVLAGGGNTSFKDSQYLYVKASGTTLADITAEGFVKMRRDALAAMWEKTYPTNSAEREAAVLQDLMEARVPEDAHKRPSVETSLHDLLPGQYVVHLHPALVNGLTCSNGGAQKAAELFGQKALWIENSEPGYVLAKLVKDKLTAYQKAHGTFPECLLLQNHGIFVSADSTEAICSIYAEIMGTLEKALTEQPDLSMGAYCEEEMEDRKQELMACGYDVVLFHRSKTIWEFTQSSQSFEPLSSSFTPDHIVYCKARPLFLEKGESAAEKIKTFTEKNGYRPLVIACQGLGFFACGETEKKAQITQKLFCDAAKIAVYSKSFGGYAHMPQELIDFITNWEVESYRAKQQ